MDQERKPATSTPPHHDRPVEAHLLPVSEPDAEVAVTYAAWRLDRERPTR